MKKLSSYNLIQLPLTVGLSDLLHNSKDQIYLNSLDYCISLSLINNFYFKNFISSKNLQTKLTCFYQISPYNQIHVYNNQSEDLLELSSNELNPSKIFEIVKINKNVQSKNEKKFQFGFKVQVNNCQNSNMASIEIFQENSCFQLIRLTTHINFAQNKILIDIFNETCLIVQGLLTMDHMSRIVFENNSMSFPVIGLWIKTQKQLKDFSVLNALLEFKNRNLNKRCIFTCEQTKKVFFYMIKINSQKKIQTYLVSHSISQPVKKVILADFSVNLIEISSVSNDQFTRQKYKTKKLSKCYQIIDQQEKNQSSSSSINSQENGMNFTLRKQQNLHQLSTLESLISHSYLSPIKQLNDLQGEQNLFSEIYCDSPQFSTLMKESDAHENLDLRQKVKQQQNEIKKLKQIIGEMYSELEMYKTSRTSTHYESNRKKTKIPSEILSQISLESKTQSNSLSPQYNKGTRLRQSDLKSNSVSKSRDWLRYSSSKKSLPSKSQILCEKILSKIEPGSPVLPQKCKKNTQNLPEIREQNFRDPWEYMELIED